MYELVSPVNIRVVMKYMGKLMIGTCAVLAVPMIVFALIFMEPSTAAVYGATGVFIATVVIGFRGSFLRENCVGKRPLQ